MIIAWWPMPDCCFRSLWPSAWVWVRQCVTDVADHTLLLRAWERAVLRLLGDTGIDLDREAALRRYAHHFDLDDGELDRYGMLRQVIQGAAIAASAPA